MTNDDTKPRNLDALRDALRPALNENTQFSYVPIDQGRYVVGYQLSDGSGTRLRYWDDVECGFCEYVAASGTFKAILASKA
jgi:hypothetical protein